MKILVNPPDPVKPANPGSGLGQSPSKGRSFPLGKPGKEEILYRLKDTLRRRHCGVVTERVAVAAVENCTTHVDKESTIMKRPLMVSALVTALSLSTGFALAADQSPAPKKAQTQNQGQIYGSQLMTKQERTEYRANMRAAKTAEEREQIRKEHHERMKERAKERGVTLPDEPPVRGGGMGSGGGGMGPGGGRGR